MPDIREQSMNVVIPERQGLVHPNRPRMKMDDQPAGSTRAVLRSLQNRQLDLKC